MELDIHPHCPKRRLENLALFGGSFVLNELAIYAADKLIDPHTMAVPQGGAIALGLVASGIATVAFDRVTHRPIHD